MHENLYAASTAVILAHATRLASLVEGTPAYAQCIELIKKNIEDFAMTTPEDAARIATNYTEAERLAVMHVCGACGVRDPTKPYCRTERLSELPADDWLRAKSEFVAAIDALSSVTLFARIDPPLPKRAGEPDPPTHRPVDVRLASLFNLVEVDGQYFHVVREALLPCGLIDRCSDFRDRRRRRHDSSRGADEMHDMDDDAEEEDEEDRAPPLRDLTLLALPGQGLPQHPPRTPTPGTSSTTTTRRVSRWPRATTSATCARSSSSACGTCRRRWRSSRSLARASTSSPSR
jgi:hypothetical protein